MENFTGARALPLLFAAIFTLNLAMAQPGGQINFIQNDLDNAKILAASSGKPILLKFSARWCLPCRVMDETVWTNPDLIEFVEKNFVAVAVDVQNFDGFALKDRYLVQVLPTILGADAAGVELFRHESSCSAGRLMDWLENFRQTASPSAVAEIDLIWMNPQEFLGNRPETRAEPVFFSTKTEGAMADLFAEKTADGMAEGWPAH